MYRDSTRTTSILTDTEDFLGLLNHLPESLADFFSSADELIVTRAPGRLDLMGGIADYSGSLVLQLPIAAAAHVALQRRNDGMIHLASLAAFGEGSHRRFAMSLDEFVVSGGPIEYAEAREKFGADSQRHWAAYVAGAFLVLMREKGANFRGGVNILISSDVPEGKGVSSSAALEVAAMQAIVAAFELDVDPRELAFLCQKVENLIAGAPCGVMDQMTASCGEDGRLLALLCQPGELQDAVKLPDDLAVWGVDSGIRHAVAGADYGAVRTAAFMGYRIIAEMAGLQCSETGTAGVVRIDDPKWLGYLANITPLEFEQSFAALLPQQMSGADFLRRYNGITDAVTSVKSDRSYPVFQATRHPIYEHARVNSFREMLQNWRSDAKPEALGEMMYQSHESYSACGLGSSGTDELVNFVREAGRASGLLGAKITGGGSGGTVAVLGRSDATDSVEKIASRYAELRGHQPLVISGSSPGAGAFGYLKLEKGK